MPIMSWLLSALMGSAPSSTSVAQHVPPEFHIETIKSVIQGFHQGWWMVLLGLKDAYFYMPIHLSHIGGSFGLLSGMWKGISLFINGRSSLLT